MVKFEDLEIWDYIKDYNNYKVSSKGRVWSIKGNKYLKPSPEGSGYQAVRLWNNGKAKTCRIHRLVALTFYFVDDATLLIDHKDRNKSNNNLLNLRFCTRSENQRNTGFQLNSKSGLKGVYWVERNKKWSTQIQINGKRKCLGLFKTKEEAYEAYKKASKEYHGDFGYAP
jgi:hypothetical protein